MFTKTITPRFGDVDGLRHINNTRLPIWFELGRDPFFRYFNPGMSFENWNLIMAHIDVDFLVPMLLGADIEIRTSVAKIGNASFTVHQEAWQNGQLSAQGDPWWSTTTSRTASPCGFPTTSARASRSISREPEDRHDRRRAHDRAGDAAADRRHSVAGAPPEPAEEARRRMRDEPRSHRPRLPQHAPPRRADIPRRWPIWCPTISPDPSPPVPPAATTSSARRTRTSRPTCSDSRPPFLTPGESP
jgi:acyl-CoA thioester hydrolase